MLHAGIEALFGRNRDGHRTRHIFHLRRRHHNHDHKDEHYDLSKFFLEKPQLDKLSIHDSTFAFGAMQGWRSTMEDKHKHLIPFDNHAWKSWSYFSIFDGHNGLGTAQSASEQLDIHLLNELNHMLDNQHTSAVILDTDGSRRSSQIELDQLYTAIKQAYFELDKDLRKIVKDDSGCVCITCLISPEKIYLVHIGDSRGIIISNDGCVLAHTDDHKPEDLAEQERIHEAGGKISKSSNGGVLRVENQLAMTRVLGDFAMDKHVVPPMADIIEYPRNSLASFIILACDGIWDVMTNEEVALFVIHRASANKLEDIVSQLLDECLRRKSTDNMSVYIVKV
ncbi:unnamed protein product [Rotaria magnacalcarata]|uniref:PPM-type phosphatase domain-containing protein n=6 Tax=Rotaria magnacalcarata TaxID=392030 RepID=A0A814Y727_9BILA|nr:unnamed protein product [Rotaria magnacalcarata]CAF1246934.1 unnamed protein product [Rotaria magnacalcarata]CAF2157277.1 unnamed protein product [Rotaria magnacalcarata]